MKIQKACLEDEKELLEIASKEFPYISEEQKRFEHKLENGQYLIFKAVVSKKIIGFIEIEIIEDNEISENKTARVNGLAVKKEFEGKGIGQKLLEIGIQESIKIEIKKITLLVLEQNKKAQQIYSKAGFEFLETYPKQIDENKVEEMQLVLEPEKFEEEKEESVQEKHELKSIEVHGVS